MNLFNVFCYTMSMKRQILIIEDEESISNLLETELSFEGYNVFSAADGMSGLKIFEEKQEYLDVVLLDWMIPKLDGLEVLRRMKKMTNKVPVIFVTARDYVGDKVAGLDAGADDYLTKPFNIEELMARLRVIFRKNTQPAIYSYGTVSLNPGEHTVEYQEKATSLTQREFALLLFLFEHQGEIISRDDILEEVWGMNFGGQLNTVDTYVRYLRKKLDKNMIETIRGLGYRLNKDK
ncbi:DNA-binding response regulator, OmpR family (Rec-wHTH domains) [Lactococcus cremoris subsp. cremoris SK11]|uniref:Transcriptional regulatory protein DltR n=2 Tax=Lactococcus lactis subsp. cremoris TaxID=1359 RepID=Q030C5_LACLS|nr:DNA-binding response regulator, OmpR family (Rec-wHTH domains) [Lactococcus cremoris subsp. cremoris SK11]